jgi:hypothetical protein
MGNLAETAVFVDDVIGKGNDVMAGLPEEVDDLRQGQYAIRIRRVDVKIAEEHAVHRTCIFRASREARASGGKSPRKSRVRTA